MDRFAALEIIPKYGARMLSWLAGEMSVLELLQSHAISAIAPISLSVSAALVAGGGYIGCEKYRALVMS